MASTPLRSASVFVNSLIQDLAQNPGLAESIKEDSKQLQERAAAAIQVADTEAKRVVQRAALEVDMDIYKTVVLALGATVVIAMVGILAISICSIFMTEPDGNTLTIVIPDGVVALASAAVGALAGLLSPLARAAS